MPLPVFPATPKPSRLEAYGEEWPAIEADFDSVYCVSPDTLILTADLEWKQAAAVTVGESLLGIDEFPKPGRGATRKLQAALVEKTGIIEAPRVRIITDRGVTTVSAEHKFLVRVHNASKSLVWKEARHLALGDTIKFLTPPWVRDDTREGGRLSGLFDGEGSISCPRPGGIILEFSQKRGGIANEVMEILARRGTKYSVGSGGGTYRDVLLLRICHLSGVLHLLGSVRPLRLIADFQKKALGTLGLSNDDGDAVVSEIAWAGYGRVVAIQTSTRTLISDGFVSHNSQVRQLTNRGMRHFTLGYDMLNPMGRDDLQRFFNLRKGKSERFDITVPWLLLDNAGFEKGTASEWTLDADTAISTASPRSGVKHGRITVPNPVLERRIRGAQKIPLFPGDTVTVSGFAKADNAVGGIGSIFLEFFTGADVFVAGGPIAGDVAFTTAYTQFVSGAVLVPGTVAYGKVSVRNTTGATAGRVLDFDDLLVDLTLACRFDAIRLEWRFKAPAFWSVDIPLREVP